MATQSLGFSLHTKRDTLIPNRPISITSNLGKILESVIMKNLLAEMCGEAIPDHQFGFMKGHSTLDALKVLDRILVRTKLSCNRVPRCKEAFDSVDHLGLVHKLLMR